MSLFYKEPTESFKFPANKEIDWRLCLLDINLGFLILGLKNEDIISKVGMLTLTKVSSMVTPSLSSKMTHADFIINPECSGELRICCTRFCMT